MRAGLAVMIPLILVSPAQACRLHSIWNYPWKERCPVTRFVARVPAAERPHRPPSQRIDVWIPLPDLANIDWGEPAQLDEETLGRLMLRAKMEDR